jgi:hypothetical protein
MENGAAVTPKTGNTLIRSHLGRIPALGLSTRISPSRLVLAKIREETDEIEAALDSREPAAIVEEIGDLLSSVANLARHVSPPLHGSKGHPALRALLCGGG